MFLPVEMPFDKALAYDDYLASNDIEMPDWFAEIQTEEELDREFREILLSKGIDPEQALKEIDFKG